MMPAFKQRKAVTLMFVSLGLSPFSNAFAVTLSNSACPAGYIEDDSNAIGLADGNFASPGTISLSQYVHNTSDDSYPGGPTDNVYTFMTDSTDGTSQWSSNYIDQLFFSGDSARNLGQIKTWLYVNGKLEETPGTGNYVDKVFWGETVSGLTSSKTYAFSFYISNAVEGLNRGNYSVRPTVSVQSSDGVVIIPKQDIEYEGTSTDDWHYFAGLITTASSQTSVTLQMIDHANGSQGNDFGVTGLRLIECDGSDTNIDTDSDGLMNSVDLDDDNDGIPDTTEGMIDTDGDGVPNSLDLDSDNDGLFDLWESGHDYATLDTSNDGRIDLSFTVGSNGIADQVEAPADSGTVFYEGSSDTSLPRDTDNDGVYDYLDLDSDNDTLTDLAESGRNDPNNIGVLDRSNVDENGVSNLGATTNPVDTDSDGLPNHIDIDSDNDGIYDVVELGGADANNDGRIDSFVDNNGDGLHDNVDGTPLNLDDTDSDGTPDVIDGIDGPGTVNTGGLVTGVDGVGGGGGAIGAVLLLLGFRRRK